MAVLSTWEGIGALFAGSYLNGGYVWREYQLSPRLRSPDEPEHYFVARDWAFKPKSMIELLSVPLLDESLTSIFRLRPASVVYGFIIAATGTLCITVSMAEMASM